MSAATVRISLAEAEAVAARFIERIEPWTDRCVVAGSIRRRLPTVGDVEIVCVPRVETTQTQDMFGEVVGTGSVDLLAAQMTTLLDQGIVEKRSLGEGATTRWGPTAKYLVFEGMAVDLFAPEAARFGWILLLRTGPAMFSRQLVRPRGLRTKDGRPGLLPSIYQPRDGWLTWRTSAERVPTPEEEDIFRLFGLDYQEPWRRC